LTVASGGGTTIDHAGDNVTLAAAPQTDGERSGRPRPGNLRRGPPRLHRREPAVPADQEGDGRRERFVRDDAEPRRGVPGRDGQSHRQPQRHRPGERTVAVVPCDDDCEAATGSDEPRSGTTVDREGETLTLVAGPETEVTGQSDLEPGTELKLTLQSTDSTSPFLLRETATVADDGSIAATMDTDSISEPVNATLTVSHDGGGTDRGRRPDRTVR